MKEPSCKESIQMTTKYSNPNDRVLLTAEKDNLDELVLLNPFGNRDFGRSSTDREFNEIVKANLRALNPALAR